MRIAGVPVRLHPTVGVCVAVAAVSAGRDVGDAKVYAFPAWARAVSGPGPWQDATAPGAGWVIAAAIGAALVVLGSILLSGLVGLIAVRRAGLRPTGMHLIFLGGAVACVEDERPREHSALEVAIGPVAAAVLAVAAWLTHRGLFGEEELHGKAALVGSVLLRTCALFNAFVIVVSLAMLVFGLLHLHLARRR